MKRARPPRPERPPAVSEEELRLFREAMRDVKPLAGPTRLPLAGPRPRTRVLPPAASPVPTAPRALEGDDLVTERWGERVEARRSGVSQDRMRALRRGEPRPEATLDLHGLTARVAEDRLLAFLAEAHRRRHRLVLIVHGRGLRSGATGAVLPDLVWQTLTAGRASAAVLALTSAPPHLGGPGALVVLLRS